MIKHENFKSVFNSLYKYRAGFYHEKLATVLSHKPNTVRKLQQEAYQLYMSRNYFRLKEVISDVQNFLLLFAPEGKFSLCQYWQTLQHNNFDPVFEYNKSIQNFNNNYRPTEQQIYTIVIQVSRFLKQFSQFQNLQTPTFRHPKIRGSPANLNELNLLKQFSNLNLVQQTPPVQPQLDQKTPNSTKSLVIAQSEQPPSQNVFMLNTDIPSNRERIQNYVLEHLMADNGEALLESYQNYYYKRWVWLQYPWLCGSLKVNFSEKMNESFASATQYIPVQKQLQLNRQALQAVLWAKLKKSNTFMITPIQKTKTKLSQVVIPSHSLKKGSKVPARIQNKGSFLSRHNQSLDSIYKSSCFSSNLSKNIAPSHDRIILDQKKMHRERVIRREDDDVVNLPTIARSIHLRIEGHLQEQEGKKLKMRQNLDHMRYQNNLLTNNLLKMQSSLQMSVRQSEVIKSSNVLKEKLKQLETKLENMKKKFDYSSLKKKRLTTLIVISKQNKIKNEEQLSNLNIQANCMSKMNTWAKSQIEKIKLKIKSQNKQSLKNKKLQLEIKQSQQKVFNQFKNIEEAHQKFDQAIEHFHEHLVEEIKQSCKINNDEVQEPANIVEQLQKSKKKVQHQNTHKLFQLMGLKKKDNLANSPPFQNFLGHVQKKRTLISKMIQLTSENQYLSKQVQQQHKILTAIELANYKSNRDQFLVDQIQKLISLKIITDCTIRERNEQLISLQRMNQKIENSLLNCLRNVKASNEGTFTEQINAVIRAIKK